MPKTMRRPLCRGSSLPSVLCFLSRKNSKGSGLVAQTLRQPPSDRTTLNQRTEGRFDEAYVMAIIDGRYSVAAHDPREMPVWDVVFEEEFKHQHYPQYTGLLQSRMLADYLRSIQQP